MTSALMQARALLDGATPLKYDCGGLCQSACCEADCDGQGGVALFPGEIEELRRVKWGRVVSLGDAHTLICDGPCERSLRPMGCRIFPLTPRFKRDGTLGLGMDSRAKAMCPLYRYGVKGLDADFTRAVSRAFGIMARDEAQRAFMREWAEREREFHRACAEFAGGGNA